MDNGLSFSRALHLQSATQLLLPDRQLPCQCSERSSSLLKSRRKAVSASEASAGAAEWLGLPAGGSKG